jgi:hypothetical protein
MEAYYLHLIGLVSRFKVFEIHNNKKISIPMGIKTIFSSIKKVLFGVETKPAPTAFIPQELLINTHINASQYYDKDDLIFVNDLNLYCAFKYEVVKDALFWENLGVSPMHTSLNRIYFQTDKERHMHNKRSAIKILDFLSKRLQFEDNVFLSKVFNILINDLPLNTSFNLIEYVINPTILVNALNDLGFLDTLTFFNPEHANFSCELVRNKTKEIFNNRSTLEQILRDNFNEENIPVLLKELLNELSVEGGYDSSELPFFYTTVIYTSIENVASFVNTFIYFILKKYPQTFLDGNHKDLMIIANELLRIYSPNFITFRAATENIKFGGVNFKQGDIIALFIGAANLDKNIFTEPTEIRFDRETNHLAFGRGQISCIGQFASFRIAFNFINNIFKLKGNVVILDEEPKFEIKGVVRLSEINAKYVIN